MFIASPRRCDNRTRFGKGTPTSIPQHWCLGVLQVYISVIRCSMEYIVLYLAV